jgi:hypothetical protein
MGRMKNPYKLKIGTKVRMEKSHCRAYQCVGILSTTIGVIVDHRNGCYGIHFPGWTEGHKCNGNCEDGTGWYVNRDYVVEASKEWEE